MNSLRAFLYFMIFLSFGCNSHFQSISPNFLSSESAVSTNPSVGVRWTGNTIVLDKSFFDNLELMPDDKVKLELNLSDFPSNPEITWYKDSKIFSTGNLSLDIQAGQPNTNGNYYFILKYESVSYTSPTFNVNVLVAPILSLDLAASDSVQEELPWSIQVNFKGTPTPTIQWQKNGVDIPGSSAIKIDIAALTMSDSGQYQAIIRNKVKTIKSNVISLTVTAKPPKPVAPEITNFPKDPIKIKVTDTFTLTVRATGNPLPKFQWKKGGVDIAGATSSIYTKVSAASDSGKYNIVVKNDLGEVSLASDIDVTIVSPPQITLNPADTEIDSGKNLSLTAGVQGVDVTYLWYKDGAATDQKTLTYTENAVTTSATANYKIVASNLAGTSESTTAKVTVRYKPVVTDAVLADYDVLEAATLALSPKFSGYPVPTYQWYFNGTLLVGQTNSSLSKVWPLTEAGLYKITATNSLGSVDVSTTVHVRTLPKITGQSQDTFVYSNRPFSLSLSATGDPAPTYQWSKNGSPIGGATTSSFAVASGKESDAGTYSVVARNAYGSATSTAIKVEYRAGPPPTISVASDLQNISAFPDFSFELANDIDLKGVTIDSFESFSGVLDGKGHTLKNITVNGTGLCGIFKSIKGQIKNLNFENIAVNCITTTQGGQHLYGPLAAIIEATATITNVNLNGENELRMKDSSLVNDVTLIGYYAGIIFKGANVSGTDSKFTKISVIDDDPAYSFKGITHTYVVGTLYWTDGGSFPSLVFSNSYTLNLSGGAMSFSLKDAGYDPNVDFTD